MHELEEQHSHSFLFFKPYGVLSRFTPDTPARRTGALLTLSAFGPFPPHVYPVGRLDADSEGLLLLTDDAQLSHHLTDPHHAHRRSYLVQVERLPEERALQRLREGGIQMHGRKTRPAEVRLLAGEPHLPPRAVPIRFRKSVPTAWLEITLSEGMNRQVRRMTAAIGHPTLRLVRVAIGPLIIGDLKPGEHRSLTHGEYALLRRTIGNPPRGQTRSSVPQGSLPFPRRGRQRRY